MRQVIESTCVTLDGIIRDPRSWAGDYFDPAAQAEALDELRAGDAMLTGRGTYEYFALAWPDDGSSSTPDGRSGGTTE